MQNSTQKYTQDFSTRKKIKCVQVGKLYLVNFTQFTAIVSAKKIKNFEQTELRVLLSVCANFIQAEALRDFLVFKFIFNRL